MAFSIIQNYLYERGIESWLHTWTSTGPYQVYDGYSGQYLTNPFDNTGSALLVRDHIIVAKGATVKIGNRTIDTLCEKDWKRAAQDIYEIVRCKSE